jgi:hypothetical protein
VIDLFNRVKVGTTVVVLQQGDSGYNRVAASSYDMRDHN